MTPGNDETGWGPFISIIKSYLAERAIEERLAEVEERMITKEEIDALDISNANITIPGTGETFDLATILEMHDISIAEFKERLEKFADRDWVTDYVNSFGFLQLADFRTRMLATGFPLGDYADERLQEWLTISPEERERKLTPFGMGLVPRGDIGRAGIDIEPGEPITPPGIPIREQVGTNRTNIKDLKGEFETIEDAMSSHRARLDAVEADIMGLIAGMPVVDIPTAGEILTSILPLDIELHGETKPFRTWLENFHTLMITNFNQIQQNIEDISTTYGITVDNRKLIDDHWGDWQEWKDVVTEAKTYMGDAKFLTRLKDIGGYPDSVISEYTDPITGIIKRPYTNALAGWNAVDIIRNGRDTEIRLDDIQKQIDEIKGYEVVLGPGDYDGIVDHLKARSWDIGGERKLFQTWLEEFNSRTIGNGGFIEEIKDSIGVLDGKFGDLDGRVQDIANCFKGDTAFKNLMDEFSLRLSSIDSTFEEVVGRMDIMADEIQDVLDDAGKLDTGAISVKTWVSNLMKALRNAFRKESGTSANLSIEFEIIREHIGYMKEKVDDFRACGQDHLGWSPS